MAVATNLPHLTLSSALGSMSSLYSDIDIYDSEAYDTDLDDEKEYIEPRPYIGQEAYKESCARLKVAPQNAVVNALTQQEMKLRYRNLGAAGIRPVIIALLKNTRVMTLDLCDTGLGDLGAGYVAQMLLDNDFVCNLDISNNCIGVTGAYALSEALKYNSSLIRLNLSGNKLTDRAAECLAVIISMNERLEELNLSHNNISENCKSLGTALAKNQCLEMLKLDWNKLKGEGAVSIIKGLHKNNVLTYLDLSHNGLKYDGALAISNMLKKNKTLRHLDVSGNGMNWQAALLIVSGLKKNRTLQLFKIGDNPLTTTGTMDLIEAVSNIHSKINTFSLKNVPVVGEFEMMAMAIRQTRPFDYEHGGIVNSHDVLGQRYDKKIDPMQKVILFMKERSLRPTELFRTFDKSVANYISHDSFRDRLKKSGLDMPEYELEDLIDHLTRRNTVDDSGFNYKTMVNSVKDQLEKDRIEAIKERERTKKIKDYHKKILAQTAIPEDEELLEYNETNSISDGKSFKSVVESIQQLNSSLRKDSGTRPNSVMSNPLTAISFPPIGQSSGGSIMSMSGSLGGKVKEFGTQDIKKKKRKKKGHGRRR